MWWKRAPCKKGSIALDSILVSPLAWVCGHEYWARSALELNRSGKSGHPCLVLDLGVKTFSLSPLIMKLAVAFS